MSSSRVNPHGRPGPRAARLFALTLAVLAAALPAAGQKAPEPQREQLLNGLRVLLVHRPADPNVLVRMRVHSGAAFDLAGREGMMTLLTEAMFDAEDFRFVEEDLGGRLEVTTDYDAINVMAVAPAASFDRVLELLRAGVLNVQLTPAAVAKLREDRLRKLGGEAVSPAEAADRAVVARLLSPHPYARVTGGTPESIARVEFGDMILARERFINPNNTTLVVAGGVEPKAVMRQLRQALGGWRKSDRVVPATFRRPDEPDARTLVVDRPGSGGAEVRLAFHGLARADRDRAAADVLAVLARERWSAAAPELKNSQVVVRHEARRDGGVFRLGAGVGTAAEAAKALAAAREAVQGLAAQPVTPAQLEAAKQRVASALLEGARPDEALTGAWLDAHTFNSENVSGPEAARALHALTPSDVQRVAARLFRQTPSAAVAVGDAAGLREEMARGGDGVEVFGESAARPANPPAPPAAEAQKKPAIQLKRPL